MADITGSAQASLALGASASGVANSAAAELGLGASATGIVGIVGTASASLSLSAKPSAVVGVIGSAAASLRLDASPVLRIAVVGSASAALSLGACALAEIAEVYAAWLLNLRSRGHAQYSNYPFNSLFLLDGRYYGISANGIEELTGGEDNGASIGFSLETGNHDFGTYTQKRLTDALLLLRTEGDMEVSTVHGDTEDVSTYSLASDGNAWLHERRRKLAKGSRATTWSVGLKNVAGADFSLSEMTLLIEPLDKI